MFSADQYSLVDFGDGRKLERFGAVVVDRPSPAASVARRQNAAAWQSAAARFVALDGATRGGCGQRGRWERQMDTPARWTVEQGALRFELRLTEFGHVGVFPEQAANWDWIARQVARLCGSLVNHDSASHRRPRVLNLFAYTGGGTLAAAAGGAEVVHVDASKSTVAWARRNAELSDQSEAPIRWIVDDAATFVARELKRGSRYHGIVLDPPSYGHGPKRRVWTIDRDLPLLLESCRTLIDEAGGFVLVTCHSPGIGPADLRQLLLDAIGGAHAGVIDSGELSLTTADGRRLHSGVMARWAGRSKNLHLRT